MHSLLANDHAPLGWEGSRRQLRTRLGVDGDWAERQIVAALAALAASRAEHLARIGAWSDRRRREKAQGRRQPTRADVARLAANTSSVPASG